MNTEINVLTPADLDSLKELVLLFEDVFEMKDFHLPEDTYLRALLEKDTFYAVTARVDGKMIGGLTVYVLYPYYSTKPLAYIYDLAVSDIYQRKGIGRSLVAFATNYFRQKGFAEVFVQADKADDYALDFYRLTNPTSEEQVVHYNYSLDVGD